MTTAARLRVAIVGGTTLPVRCAEILLEEGHELRVVVSADPDVRAWADGAGVACVEPGPTVAEELAGSELDWLFSINNLWVLPQEVLDLAGRGAVNFHDGPLPSYAGLNAPSWGLIEGARDWSVTWHVIAGGLDEGAVLLTEDVVIEGDETSLTLNSRCYEAAIASFRPLVRMLAHGDVHPTAQELSERVYYAGSKRPAAAGVLDWTLPAKDLDRLVRALDFGTYPNPLGVAKILLPGGILPVQRVVAHRDRREAPPGTVLDVAEESVTVACADGAVTLSTQTPSGSQHGLARGSQLPILGQEEQTRITTFHESVARHEPYWQERLRRSRPLELPGIAIPGTPSGALRRERVELPQSVWRDVQVGRPDVRVGDVAVGLVAAFLARVTGTTGFDVAYRDGLGPPVAGFDGRLFETQPPLTVDAALESPIRDTVLAVLDSLVEVRTHETFARDLVARTDGLARAEQPVAVWQLEEGEAPTDPASAVTFAVASDGGSVEVVADAARVDPEDVVGIAAELRAFVSDLSTRPGTPLSELFVLSDDTLARITEEWNATDTPYPHDALIHELVADQAAQSPDRLAVACRGVELSYAELDERSNRMARHLQGHGVGRGARVGVCVERSVELVVALLGVLKAGAAYVPLDPSYPADRIRFMVEDAKPAALVADDASAERLLAGIEHVVRLGEESEEDAAPLEQAGASSDLAYVIYTSGSTGRPKGVMITHRNVVNFFTGMDAHVQHDEPGVLLSVTSVSFDISVLELFWTLTRGFSVVLHADDPLVATTGADTLDFSLFFFASDDADNPRERYRLLTEAARFADANGFSAVWTPERHFHAFGGLFPNPSVTSAVLAAVTERVQIRAGSVVAPLHNPVRIAEEWAFVDNISNGRVGISFASGWQPDDFVLAPESFTSRKELMFDQIELVQRLWRGEPVTLPRHDGQMVEIRILPRPVRPELPIWVTAAGNPETFRVAGAKGFGVLTHLLGQSVPDLATKIEVYRQARRDGGHDPRAGHVVVMLHAFVGPDDDEIREQVREPLKAYLRSSVDLIQRAAWTFPTFRERAVNGGASVSLDVLSDEELDEVLDFSFERYFETSGLLGSPERCVALAEELAAIGVDEIACLVDFHGTTDVELAHLPDLDAVRRRVVERATGPDLSIPALVGRYGVTHLQCTPSLASVLVQSDAGRQALGGLRQLLVGGEALPVGLAATLAELVDGEVLNMYGPTETTIWSTVWPVDGGGETVLIGRPIANTRLYVLDDARRPVAVGAAGELYIGGDGVAAGYFERPELTAERFVANPLRPDDVLYRTGDLVRYRRDGEVEFLGRIDHQVKIRGHRVEIGEIEAVLGRLEGVREAVVVAGEDQAGTTLTAYVAGSGLHHHHELRRELRLRLPEFMVPTRIELVDALPRTPNGKIDRARLPHAGTNARVPATLVERPRDGLEDALVAIWQDELGVQPIGTDESFFELGGHSLLAVRVFTQIEKRFGVRLPLATLFRSPTIAQLAVAIREAAPSAPIAQVVALPAPAASAKNGSAATAWRALVPIRPTGSRPPLFLVHAHGGNVLFYNDLVRRLGGDQPVYALQAHGIDGSVEPLETFEAMAHAYVEEIRSVQPHGPYRLGGDCLGGVLAYEMAQQLIAQGEEVEIVAMVDSFHPQYRPHVSPSLYGFAHQAQLIRRLHVPNLVRLSWPEKWRYARTKGAKAVSQLLRHVRLGKRSTSRDPLGRTQAALERAFDAYRPRPYGGRVVLFRSARQPWGIADDPLLGWHDLAPKLETFEIDSYFQCGVLEPAVEQLASELAEHLQMRPNAPRPVADLVEHVR